MSSNTIICTGSDLAITLSDIRARGGVVTDLITGVGGNAGYKVNYFERVTELADVSVVGSDHSRKWPSQAVAGSTPAALNPFPFACGDCDPCLGGRPDQCAIFPTKNPFTHQGETLGVSIETRMAALQTKLMAAGKIKQSKPRQARMPYCDA